MNLIGQTFNRLTVIERRGSNSRKNALYLCRCECGTEKILQGYRVRGGIIKSCGCLGTERRSEAAKKTAKSLLGQRFGMLLVIQRLGTSNHGNALWLCRCDCGNTSEANAGDLAKGSVNSCGCLRRERARSHLAAINTTHGLSKTRGYRNALWMKRKAKKLQATPPWANLDVIREFYQNCPAGYHVDHIVPLQAKLASGLHVEANLQYLPKLENETKSNNFQAVVENVATVLESV